MTLTEFLLSRIADDEATARAVPGAQAWTMHEHVTGAEVNRWQVVSIERDEFHQHSERIAEAFIGYPFGAERPVVEHIARHDPAHVLAECQAKRQRVGVLAEMEADPENRLSSYAYALLCREAMPYADHPDYREEWKL